MKAVCKICGKSYRYFLAKYSKLSPKCPRCRKESERKRLKQAYKDSNKNRKKYYDSLGNKLPYYLRG